MKKSPPKQFLSSTQAKINESKAKLELAKKAIAKELANGKLSKKRTLIDRAYIVRRAGLNRWFLKGNAHKDDTKKDLEEFVQQVNKELSLQLEGASEREIERLKEEIRLVTEKYHRLADTVHDWATRMRSKNREIKNMKVTMDALTSQLSGKVVPFK